MSLAWKMLARDWRAGELRVLAAALVVAVAAVTSVAFFADRLAQAVVRDAHQLLGADLVLRSDHPWHENILKRIQSSGLAAAEAVNFISMARGAAGSHGFAPISDAALALEQTAATGGNLTPALLLLARLCRRATAAHQLANATRSIAEEREILPVALSLETLLRNES